MGNDFNTIYSALLLHLVNEAKNCILEDRYDEAYTIAKVYEIFANLDMRGEV